MDDIHTHSFEDEDAPNFGIFHLSIHRAAELIFKIHCLEGIIEYSLPDDLEDYSLDMPELSELYPNDYTRKFESLLSNAVQTDTLKSNHITRSLDDIINIKETYIFIDELGSWLEARGCLFYGDWFEEYMDNEIKVSEKVWNFVQVTRSKITPSKLQEIQDLDTVKLFYENQTLKQKLNTYTERGKAKKPLHTKERESLLKMVIGMAMKGYAYDPKKTRNSSIPEIANDLELLGITLDQDTVRKWINEAKEHLPQEEKI